MRDRLLVLLFAGALAAPWIDASIRPDEARSPERREHRRPAPEPELSLEPAALWRYPEAYDSYFKDSLGLRDVLLRWNSLLALRLFGASPTEQVLLGRDGWYFYTGNHSVEIFRGLRPLADDELSAWKHGLEARRDWLRGQGIDYVFVIAPNKETVYPDFMPAGLEKLGPTRLEQFAEYMQRNSDLDFLDLRPAFAAARKNDGPQNHLYLEEGTHWNARGSMVAYQTILQHLAARIPGLAPLADELWKRVPYDTSGDTWASNMYIGDLSRQREVGLMREVGTARSRFLNAGLEGSFGPGRKFLRGTEDAQMPRALLFHDSFGPFIENMLAEHFARLECVWSYDLDANEVLALQPRIVIDMWVERTFDFRDPNKLMPRSSEPAQEEFLRSREVCLALDPSAPPAGAEPKGKLEMRSTRDEHGPALLLETHSAADTLLLPPLAPEPKGRPLLHIVLDSPKKALLDVFYLQTGDRDYSRQRNCFVALEAGHNDLYLRMPEPRVQGRLRLRPALCKEGPYLLRVFEVRSGLTP